MSDPERFTGLWSDSTRSKPSLDFLERFEEKLIDLVHKGPSDVPNGPDFFFDHAHFTDLNGKVLRRKPHIWGLLVIYTSRYESVQVIDSHSSIELYEGATDEFVTDTVLRPRIPQEGSLLTGDFVRRKLRLLLTDSNVPSNTLDATFDLEYAIGPLDFYNTDMDGALCIYEARLRGVEVHS